jgi:hypothetical protein
MNRFAVKGIEHQVNVYRRAIQTKYKRQARPKAKTRKPRRPKIIECILKKKNKILPTRILRQLKREEGNMTLTFFLSQISLNISQEHHQENGQESTEKVAERAIR